MKEKRIMSLTKLLKDIIEKYWLIAVAPDYMQFLFVLMFDYDLQRLYLNEEEKENV